MQTETFKKGDRVTVYSEFGGPTLGVYIEADKQSKNHHMIRLEGCLRLERFHTRDIQACAGDYVAFTKDDLKTGMYARNRRGDILTVLLGTKDGDLLVNQENTKSLVRYTSFLEDEDDPQNTIQSIFQPNNMFNYLNTRKDSTAVWHREPEREPMTLSQIEKELGKRIRLIEE